VDPTFEVIRFQVAPAGGDVAVIELEGRPTDPRALEGRVALLLEGPVERSELRAIVEPDGVADGLLRASFAAPLELATHAETRFTLAVGRGPLVELPTPDGAGDAGLEVRLARTVNSLRGELSDARRRLGGIVGNVRGELAAEREGAAIAREEAARVAAERDEAARAAAVERERLLGELGDAQAEADELREELARAQARIAQLEATVAVPRAPRVPRAPGHHPHRPPRGTAPTEEHAPVVRTNHSSLGRSTARTAMLVALALVLVVIVVVVLQVRVL
jgi:hypothetical protein